MLPETLFCNLPHTFLLKPLLFAEKAMEFYGWHEGHEYDFLVPQEEFRRLLEVFQESRFITPLGETGVRVGSYEFYSSLYGFTYYHLEREAIDQQDYMVIHPEMLLFLKTLSLIREPENEKARQDMFLLMQKIGVWQPVPEHQIEEQKQQNNAVSLEGTFEEVKDITVTRLAPKVRDILKQHGCRVDERGYENIYVTFPANTRRQMLFSPILEERTRILLSDGLELRHEIDQMQEMSIISVVQWDNTTEV